MEFKTKKEKVLSITIICLTIIIIFGGAFFASELKNCKSCGAKTTDDLSLIKEAPVQNLANGKEDKVFGDLYDSDKYSVIYLARPTCSHCVAQTPRMKEIAKNKKVNIYYLNTDNLSDSQFLQLFKVDTDLFGINGSNFGTPTIIILKDGEVIDSLVGEAENDIIIQLLSTYDLI